MHISEIIKPDRKLITGRTNKRGKTIKVKRPTALISISNLGDHGLIYSDDLGKRIYITRHSTYSLARNVKSIHVRSDTGFRKYQIILYFL
jgi:hypothetical protein